MLVKPVRAQAIRLFAETFGEAPRAAASAPALVPLLGDLEGTNVGPLLAIAARGRVAVAAGDGEDGFLDCVVAPGRRERVDMRESAGVGWTERLSAVLREVRVLGRLPEGVRVAVASELPDDLEGAPSAAFAVATARAFAALGTVKLTGRQLAGVAFRAEQGRAQWGPGVAGDAVAALARPSRGAGVRCSSRQRLPTRGRCAAVASGGSSKPGSRETTRWDSSRNGAASARRL
jgi:galactokinase